MGAPPDDRQALGPGVWIVALAVLAVVAWPSLEHWRAKSWCEGLAHRAESFHETHGWWPSEHEIRGSKEDMPRLIRRRHRYEVDGEGVRVWFWHDRLWSGPTHMFDSRSGRWHASS